MSKERKSISNIFLGTSIVMLFLDSFVNLRIYLQVGINYVFPQLVEITFKNLTQSVILLFSLIGGFTWALVFIKLAFIILYSIYIVFGSPSVSDQRPKRITYIIAVLASVWFFISAFYSPYQRVINNELEIGSTVIEYFVSLIVSVGCIMYCYGSIGRWFVFGGSSGMKATMESDPFGNEARRFNQTTEKMENEYSVNVPYTFVNAKGVLTKGWINFVNIFRAVMVIGTPGSGKSYTFFLSAIEQMVDKGFTMLIYDFKYKELSRYTLNCLRRAEENAKGKLKGVFRTFSVVTFDNIFESQRCNVLQPALIKDFTVDAYGASNIFLTALNKTWSTKEGDFFPESAKNLTAGGIWALTRYQNGKYCSLPHLIEFLSMDTKSIVKSLVALKDNSLSNVIRPFEEALEQGALEQLQGQMGTVRIALSRLTSPVVYWICSEDPTEKSFSFEINSKDDPKILCLGSSGKNQMINNIFFSLFIAQIFRLVNVKGRLPLGVMLDEVVTLSFPKGTLDTLIATARSNKISVWLGFQDLSQLVRDFSRDVAEALFKMIGNTVSGNVEDDTAERMMKRIGKISMMKQSMSISTDGDVSFSYSENVDYAVPESFFGKMSQGTFAGKVADNFDEIIKEKVFYGQSAYVPYFNDDNMPHEIPMTPYWKAIFENDCKNMDAKEKEKHVDQILQANFERIRQDIENMRFELLGAKETA